MTQLRFLPAWWVRQYMKACVLPQSATERLRKTRLCVFEPALSREDWDLFSLLIGHLQQRVLASPRRPEQWIRIDDAAFLHACSDQPLAEDLIVRFWGLLPSLRAKSKATPLPFSQCEATQDGLRFRVQRSDFRALFGFDVVPQECVGESAPEHSDGAVLVREDLWAALPIDLRLPYLSMEQNIQAQANHGETVFALGVRDFFPPIEPSDTVAENLIDQLRHLLQLGRILIDREWLQQMDGVDAGSVKGDDSDMVLAWRVRDSQRDSYLEIYRRALESMVATLVDGQIDALIDRWVPGSKAKERRDWALGWWQVLASYDVSCDDRATFVGERLGVSVALLFFEYATRVSSGEDLPYLVADRRVQSLFAATTDLRRKFHQFVDLVSESEEFLLTLIRESRSREHRPQALPVAPEASSIPTESPAGEPAEVLPLSADPAPPRDKERSEARRLSTALQSRMRKIATEELKKMDETRFRSLKRTYLESLDEAGRRVMLDVQKRMQARLFDDHLRQHLIRFMVENPGAWTAPAAKNRPQGGSQ